jgi:hypothetical protein
MELPENIHQPTAFAQDFATEMKAMGYGLDFSIDSLTSDFEKLFDAKDVIKISIDFETGMACYLGEVLKLYYSGQWRGHCSARSGANFYTSYMVFGDYKFQPFTYVGYRVANGREDTGNLENFLQKLIPSLEAGRDLKQDAIKQANQQGRIFHDTEPWI